MNEEFRLVHMPGWQNIDGYATSEYTVAKEVCYRVIADDSKRHSTPVLSVCREKEKVQRIFKRINEIDWKEVIVSADKLIVDGIGTYCIEGEFGKVSAPLFYAREHPKVFSKEFIYQCELIVKLFEELATLDFEDTSENT